MVEPANNLEIFLPVEEGAILEATNLEVKLENDATVDGNQKQNPPTSKSADGKVLYQPKRIKCPDCKFYSAENEEKMTRHIRKVHRGENPFQCYMCDYSTYNKVCFEEHVRVHQGIKPYKCSFCPHRTVSKKNMKKHELVHRPDNPLRCRLCEYFGRHRRALDFHMKKCHYDYEEPPPVTDETGLSCQRCSMKFESKEELRSHNKSQKKCSECEFIACSRSLATLHSMKKHGIVPTPRKAPIKKHTFTCKLCTWSSSHVPRVLLHLIHHPNQSVNENIFDLSILRKHGIVQ